MSEFGNNATPPSPAIAPGSDTLDIAREARHIGMIWAGDADAPQHIRTLRATLPKLDAPFFQAGLAGYSDAAMRIIARRHGAPLCVTEALLDRMLLGGGRGFDKADLELIVEALPSGHEDQPLIGQIIGSDPDEMAAAALKMVEQGKRGDKSYRLLAYGDRPAPASTDPRIASPSEQSAQTSAGLARSDGTIICGDEDDAAVSCNVDDLSIPEQYDVRDVMPALPSPITRPPHNSPAQSATQGFATIDVNLACPVKKIDKKSRGGHWLSDPAGAIEILKAVRAAVPAEIPCTVKLRRAYDDTPEMARNFEIIFDAAYTHGYAFATVHARTVEQRYIGPSRWTFLRELRQRHPNLSFFGSGDIWDVHDVFRMLAYTGVSGVSIARGCIGNPWIFRQARQMMAGQAPQSPSIEQQRAVLLEHFELSCSLNGEQAAGRMMRKFGIKFARHHPRAEEVKMAMCRVSTLEQWRAVLDAFYVTPALATI
jgi:tRNA-dihydrouridine synthase